MAEFWVLRAVSLAVLAAGLGTGACESRGASGDPRAEAKQLFDASCAKCHGRDGRGGVPRAEGSPAPTNFNDAAFQASRRDEELGKVIRQGKGAMPPFGALFDEAQTKLLIKHIRAFGPMR